MPLPILKEELSKESAPPLKKERQLEAFIDGVMEDVEKKPDEPSIGIYKQRLPNWIRKTVRSLITPFNIIDVAMQKLARKIIKPPHVWEGGCKKRGACCHYILIEQRKTFFGRLYLWWHKEINGFFPRSNETFWQEDKEYLVMGCRYLKKNNQCGNYKQRPLVCRKWPILHPFGKPEILKGCGFKAVLRQEAKQTSSNQKN